MLPQFRPEERGKGRGLPSAHVGSRLPKRAHAALQACAGVAASCSPSWAQREPSLARRTRAPPPSPVPALIPPTLATRISEEAGEATQPEPPT